MMSFNSSWRPAESEIDIINERSWLAGTILTAVAYGIVFILFVLTFKQLIRTITKDNYTQRLFFIIYITLLFILATLYVGSLAKMTELGFIDYRLFPGGPAAFIHAKLSLPIGQIATVSFVIINLLANGMLMYRYLVIFRNRDTRQFPLWVVMLIPVLGYMAYFSISVAWLIQVSAPDSSLWTTSSGAINLTEPFGLVALAFNVSMTMAICARLLLYRRRITSVLGPNHGTHYTSLAAIVVESASLSCVFGLLFLISFALQDPIQNLFIQLPGEIDIISCLLIINRVAYGAAWARKTPDTLFGRDSEETQISNGVRVQVEVAGPHVRPLNHPSNLGREQGGNA